ASEGPCPVQPAQGQRCEPVSRILRMAVPSHPVGGEVTNASKHVTVNSVTPFATEPLSQARFTMPRRQSGFALRAHVNRAIRWDMHYPIRCHRRIPIRLLPHGNSQRLAIGGCSEDLRHYARNGAAALKQENHALILEPREI